MGEGLRPDKCGLFYLLSDYTEIKSPLLILDCVSF